MKKLKRRNFVNYLLGGSLAGMFGSSLYPIIRFLIPPRQTQVELNRVEAAKVGELAPNSFKIFKFGNSPGILINTSNGELIAFTAICTHMACTVRYDDGKEAIHCPCHNGWFDLAGKVLSGPPPAPLEQYDIQISGESIFVSRRT